MSWFVTNPTQNRALFARRRLAGGLERGNSVAGGPQHHPRPTFTKNQVRKNPLAASHDRFYWENIFITKTEISEEQQQMPICIEIPIVMDYEKWHAFLAVFRVCRTREAFPYTPHTHQHQTIHFQHKINFIRFSTWFSYDFEIDLHRKIDGFCSDKHSPSLACRRKYNYDCKNHWFFDANRTRNRVKIKPKFL